MDHTILYQLRAEIRFAGTQTPDPLLVHMHETQTAALVAADNSVILHFLKALWSYRIMQSLLWNKDAQPSGVTQIYFYPEKTRCSSCRLHMPHENYEAGSKKRQKITIYISVIHSITPLTTIQHVSNLLGRSSYMQSNTYLCKGNRKMSATSARCCKASVPFVSVL